MDSKPVAQLVECPNCSGPLDVPLGGGLVHCGFCGSRVQIAPPTPAPRLEFPVEPVPTPPSAQQTPWVVSIVIGVVIVAVASMVAVTGFRAAVTHGSSVPPTRIQAIGASRLKDIEAEQSLAQVAAWAGVRASSQERLELNLEGSRFSSIVFMWPEPGATNMTWITLTARAPIAESDSTFVTAHSVFGSRFVKDPDGGYAFESNGVRFAVNGRNVEVRVFPGKRSDIKRPMAVLWQVERSLVLELPVTIDDETRRNVLGTGYPLRTLARVDQNTDIDQSSGHLTAIFPGIAGMTLASNLDYIIPLDHPWFREACLTWKNEKGSKLRNVRLDPPPFMQRFPNQTEIRDCLARRFGPARDAEIDHLANDHSYQFQKYWPHASAYVGSTYLWLDFEGTNRVYPVNLKAVIEAFDACRSQ